MSQFHNIFCASDAPISRRDIAEYAVDGWYGDGEPMFSPDPSDDDDAGWASMQMRLPGVAKPVIFQHDVDAATISELVAEAIAEHRVTEETAGRLRASRQIIGIELFPETLDDDAWELLDQIQAFTATRLNGILVTADGVYDNNLQHLD